LALLLDVYQPDNANGHAIIVIPGSGWHQPRSYDATPLNKPDEISLKILGRDLLLESGYTLFIPNHRSAPLFRYPAAVEDVRRAVRFVRHQAEQYHIDPAHIGAIGHSSGGHLVSMLGLMDGVGEPYDPSPVNQESSKVQAVVAIAAPTDLLGFAMGPEGHRGAVTSFVGSYIMFWLPKEIEKIEYTTYATASPITYVTPDDPAFLVVHGTSDHIVPFSQSEILVEKLTEAGVPVEFVSIKGGNHLLAVDEESRTITEPYYEKMIELFDRQLRKD
jgi:acetyl esterase/lipase